MKIIENKQFADLIKQKMIAGMRKQIEKSCSKHCGGSSSSLYSVIHGLGMAANVLGDDGPDILMVRDSGYIFCFSLKERGIDDWTKVIRGLSISTPRKMLVKMLASRLKELENFHNTDYRKWAGEKSASTQISCNAVFSPIPDMNNKDEIIAYFETRISDYHLRSTFQKVRKKVMQVLNREDVDDTVVMESWNLAVTGILMES